MSKPSAPGLIRLRAVVDFVHRGEAIRAGQSFTVADARTAQELLTWQRCVLVERTSEKTFGPNAARWVAAWTR